jgi:hypothetical protein
MTADKGGPKVSVHSISLPKSGITPAEARKLLEQEIRRIPDSQLLNFKGGSIMVIG